MTGDLERLGEPMVFDPVAELSKSDIKRIKKTMLGSRYFKQDDVDAIDFDGDVEPMNLALLKKFAEITPKGLNLEMSPGFRVKEMMSFCSALTEVKDLGLPPGPTKEFRKIGITWAVAILQGLVRKSPEVNLAQGRMNADFRHRDYLVNWRRVAGPMLYLQRAASLPNASEDMKKGCDQIMRYYRDVGKLKDLWDNTQGWTQLAGLMVACGRDIRSWEVAPHERDLLNAGLGAVMSHSGFFKLASGLLEDESKKLRDRLRDLHADLNGAPIPGVSPSAGKARYTNVKAAFEDLRDMCRHPGKLLARFDDRIPTGIVGYEYLESYQKEIGKIDKALASVQPDDKNLCFRWDENLVHDTWAPEGKNVVQIPERKELEDHGWMLRPWIEVQTTQTKKVSMKL